MASLLERTDLTWPQTMLQYGAMVLYTPDELFEQLPGSVDNVLAVFA